MVSNSNLCMSSRWCSTQSFSLPAAVKYLPPWCQRPKDDLPYIYTPVTALHATVLSTFQPTLHSLCTRHSTSTWNTRLTLGAWLTHNQPVVWRDWTGDESYHGGSKRNMIIHGHKRVQFHKASTHWMLEQLHSPMRKWSKLYRQIVVCRNLLGTSWAMR